MTRNEQYWIDRADRRMDSYTLSAIAQARIINQSYNQLCNYVQSEIAKILRHVGDEGTLAYEYRMKRLTALLERTNKRMQELYGVTLGDTTEFLRSVIPEAYYHTIFDIAQGTGYQPVFSAVNNRLIDKIINENWSGQNYSKRIWRNTDALSEKVREILTEAAMSGESIYKTSRRLSEAFAVSEYVSKRLIQTETTYACGQAELASYNELDIAEYKYVATLDERTCPICGGHDGEIYLVKDAKPGVNYKPMHPHCHCDMLAYFGEEYEPKERAARDKNGNRIRVPADMTYKEWYKNYIENGSQSPPTPARDNNTPKPSGKPQQLPVKPSEGNAVEVPVSEPINPSGAYTDTPIPPKINNQSIDNSVQNDIIETELKMSADSGFTLKEKHYDVIENAEQVAAVEKYAKEVLSVGNLKLSGLKNGEVIQPMLERLAVLKEAHNKGFSQIIVDSTMLDTDFAMVAPDLSLHLNAKYMNSPEATADFLNRMKELKLLPKGHENTDFIITHEYMHFISRSEVDNLRSKVHKVIPDETKMLKNSPSKNSLISKNEFVADSMAMIEFGNKEKYSESKWNSWKKIHDYFFK